MCGRTTLVVSVDEIAEVFGVAPTLPPMPPRYNVAPGQDIVVVRPRTPSERELALVRWGLVPAWADDPKIANRCINARSETIANAPAFRDAFRAKRCLVVVDGFYEWKDKQPRHVRLQEGGVFALAGVWETWRDPGGKTLESCAIVTTAAQGQIKDLHSRMPLILAAGDRDRWLSSPEDARAVIAEAKATQAARAAELAVIPVARRVGDVKNDDAGCLASPADEEVAPPKQVSLFR